MQLNRFDLNLLIALDALLREKNVTRAAERVYISQPSMSGALQRLREHFNDQLLVRVGRDMELTPKAEALVKPVREILLLAQATLEQDAAFDPGTARRRFTLCMSDYCNVVLMPHVVSRLAQVAPDIQIHVEPLGGTPLARLESGEVDMCVMPDDVRLFGAQEANCAVRRAPLFTDRMTCVVAKDHPTVRDTLTREQYFGLPHVSARFGGMTMTLEQFTLGHLWTDIKVEATAPGFVGMLFMLPGTPYIATVQKRLADVLAPSIGIKAFDPPIEMPPLKETLAWHERSEFEPGHAWMRKFLLEVGKTL